MLTLRLLLWPSYSNLQSSGTRSHESGDRQENCPTLPRTRHSCCPACPCPWPPRPLKKPNQSLHFRLIVVLWLPATFLGGQRLLPRAQNETHIKPSSIIHQLQLPFASIYLIRACSDYHPWAVQSQLTQEHWGWLTLSHICPPVQVSFTWTRYALSPASHV